MMDNNQGYKNRALASLEGKWSNGIIATIIYLLLSGFLGSGISMSFQPMGEEFGMGAQGVWALLCLPLEWGATIFFLNLIRKGNIAYERLFDGYKDFIRIFLAEFLVTLCVAIGLLLLIVPGIIALVGLAQTEYILKDDKEISCSDAMKKSWEMMKGHKMELFWLILSFIGWLILSVLTFGFGFIFFLPYFYSTLAHYYEDLKAENA